MGSQAQVSPAQLNQIARAAIRARAVKMTQSVFSNTYSAATGNITSVQPNVIVNPRNVGLILGFWVKVVATVKNGSGVTIDATDFGPANVFSQIQFTDLNNNIRIQTTGWHLNILNSIKARRPFGSTIYSSYQPLGPPPAQDSVLSGEGTTVTGGPLPYGISYGSNFAGVMSAPASIAASASGIVTTWYWVPLAYSDHDYRGAVYANVVNATMQLQFALNAVPVVANGTDSTAAMYVGHTAGSVASAVVSAVTVTVYQSYLDQLPVGQGGVLLPLLDLATIYEMKQTSLSSINAGQDFPYQYANFRDFISTTAIFVNTGATGARGDGTDVNYWALQSANFTNLWKKEPGLIATETRNHLQFDLPPGTYYFGSREKPISTTQYGNMELILNALTAGTGAYLLIGTEDFALVQTLSMAGSLAAS